MKSFYRYLINSIKLTEGRIFLLLLFSIIATFAEMLAAASMLTAVSQGIAADSSNIIQKIISLMLKNTKIGADPNKLITLWLALTAFFFAIRGATLMTGEWYKSYFIGQLYKKMQRKILDQLYSADYQVVMSYNIGELGNIIVIQLRVVIQSLRAFITVISSSIFAMVYLVLPIMVNHQIAIIAIIIFLPMGIVIRYVSHKLKLLSVEDVLIRGQLNSFVLQLLTHYKYLKSTSKYPRTHCIIDSISDKLAKIMVQLSVWGSIAPNMLTPFAVAIICAITYWQVIYNGVPIIEACAVMGLLYHSAQQAISIPTSYQKFLSSAGAIDVYNDISKRLEKNLEPVKESSNIDFSGDILLKDVCFYYKNSDKTVLSNINMRIPGKSFVGIVGESGAGKSTLMNLINGLLKPSSGTISISGIDYDKINMNDLRNSISYVSQEPVIFNDTVRNNITLWEPGQEVQEDRLWKAIKQASAHSFIEKMKDGVDTMLGDNGINISGGQRQRISIAREIYKNTPILMLDEATSALDSETEQIIQSNLSTAHGEKTIIAIAHRLSTVKNCDKIFVLENGRIIEEGNYSELIAKAGRFKEMVDRQSL